MALVGKKFPNITVDAISFMGDNLRINKKIKSWH